MIAGVGGASLGTEILKCLTLSGRYEVYGCDVSPTAYGLYAQAFTRTFLVDRETYVSSVIDACHEVGTRWIVPGGEQPMILLGAAIEQLAEAEISLIGNDIEIISTFSNKANTFEKLSSLGIPIPRTAEAKGTDNLEWVGMPCIVKPATGTGGSAMVFFATTIDEALVYAGFIRRSGQIPLVQEYIDVDDGEFTIGVLSFLDGNIAGSVALRRSLDAKLSVLSRSRGGLISSGYSQGFIGNFPEIRKQAESIAKAIGSRGPINIQGRVRHGQLIPFEINPRFSASTYLRALAGFNEIDIYMRNLVVGELPGKVPIREGWYLRSLTELFVAPEDIKS